MKRMLLTMVLSGLVISAVLASEGGRTLTDQELWQVRGAAAGDCALTDSGCLVNPIADCQYANNSTNCALARNEAGGAGPWWTCGIPTPAIPGAYCNKSGSGSTCKISKTCKWTKDYQDGGMNWHYKCLLDTTSTAITSNTLSWTRAQVTGVNCP